MSPTHNPFAGYPRTTERQSRDGQKQYVVKLRAPGPIAANVRDKLTFVGTAIGAIVALIVAANATDLPTLSKLAICASPLPLYLTLRGSFEWLLSRRVSVAVSPDRISVTKLALPRHYDRSYSIKFVLRDDERRERKAKIIEHRRCNPDARRRFFPERNYYDSSYRLSIEVLGQAYHLMTIYGQSKATRICARLNAIHNSVESTSGRGSGIALIASDDWADSAAGELS